MGTVLYWIGLLGFGIMVALDALYNRKIAAKLLAQDAAVIGEIRPNAKAISLYLLPVFFLILMIVGIAIANGTYHILLIVFIGGGGMGLFLGADASTYLKREGEILIIHRLGKIREYQLSQVRAVSWKTCRGVIGKAMVLVMNDGTSYWFNMDTFAGVQNMYQILSAERACNK